MVVSSPALDQVFDFSRAGVRELNLDLHLDSPTRERAPYEGDNLIHMLIQGYDDGDWTNSRVHAGVADRERDVARGVALLVDPLAWEYWQATGDLRPGRAYYNDLKAFLPTQYLRSDGLVEKAPGGAARSPTPTSSTGRTPSATATSSPRSTP